MTVHVYPVNDTIEHDLESTECQCNPRLEFYDDETLESYGEVVVIHNAMDGRE